MPSEAAAAQLTRYAASYTHIRVSLLNTLLDAEEKWMDNEAREIAEIEEWREDQ
jgi:hypothetical protein